MIVDKGTATVAFLSTSISVLITTDEKVTDDR